MVQVKTPMIEFLISILQKKYKVAVLSRGYKRKSKGFILASPTTEVEELGDEPYQIYSKFPQIDLAVDSDRQNGISILEKDRKPNVILLDDAFQHRKVNPSFSFLLTAYDNLFCDDWYLPTGTLRDSKRQAKRANIIVVTKCSPKITLDEQLSVRRKLNATKNQNIVFGYLDYSTTLIGHNQELQLNDLKEKEVTLVTGIANPKPLLLFLKNQGISFEHKRFKDHHFFTAKELQLLTSKPLVLTTEKDYVRLKGKVQNLYYISIKHKLLNNGNEVIEAVLNKLMS